MADPLGDQPPRTSGALVAAGAIGLALILLVALALPAASPYLLFVNGYEIAAVVALLAMIPPGAIFALMLVSPPTLQRILARFTRVDLRDGGHVAALAVLTLALFYVLGAQTAGGVFAVEQVLAPPRLADGPPDAPAPGAPEGLNLTANLTSAGVFLDWTEPSLNGTDVEAYRIYRGLAPGAETFLRRVENQTNFTDASAFGGLAYTYVVTAVGPQGEGRASAAVTVVVPVDEALILGAIIENTIIMILPALFYVSFVHGKGPGAAMRDLGFRSEGAGRGILLGIGAIVAFEILFAFVVGLIAQYQDIPANERAQAIGLGIGLGGALAISVGAALSEEVLFRGFLQPRIGMWGQAVVFGIAHLAYVNVLQVVVTFLLALLFGYIYKRTGTLWAPIAAHFAFDLINLTFIVCANDPARCGIPV